MQQRAIRRVGAPILPPRPGVLGLLGDGQRAEFELQFQGFAGKLAKNAGDVPPPEDDEPAPFTGPQYPIEEDEGGS